MIDFSRIDDALSNVPTRTSEHSERLKEELAELKREAVRKNDQVTAKKIWCYEIILQIQDQYVHAFEQMTEKYFYSAWCILERVEINLLFLERHFNIFSDIGSRFRLPFILQHTQQFQSLFPYTIFGSPGFLIEEKVCTICRQVISIRNPCGHIVGEIYDGEMCGREITKVHMLEISVTPNPKQKYTVLFLDGADQYNYFHINYVVTGLKHPFADWKLEWAYIEEPIEVYKDTGRNDPCPCGSGKKFKKCCIRKKVIKLKHLNVIFSEPPPPTLSSFEKNGFVAGRGEVFRPENDSITDNRDPT